MIGESIGQEMATADAGATLEEMAAIDFEAWDEVGRSAPSNQQMEDMGKVLRVAIGIMCSTKRQLIDSAREVGMDATIGAIDELEAAAEMASAYRALLQGAYGRLEVAQAVVALEAETEKGGTE